MRKQIIIVAAIVFAIVGVSGTASAWNNGQGHGKKGCWTRGNGPMANLTQAQQTELQALHQKFIDETAATRAALGAKQGEIRILMQTSSPDRQKLVALANEAGDLKKALRVKQIDFALGAKKIAPEINFPAGFRGFGKMGKRGSMGCPGNGMGIDRPAPDSSDTDISDTDSMEQ